MTFLIFKMNLIQVTNIQVVIRWIQIKEVYSLHTCICMNRNAKYFIMFVKKSHHYYHTTYKLNFISFTHRTDLTFFQLAEVSSEKLVNDSIQKILFLPNTPRPFPPLSLFLVSLSKLWQCYSLYSKRIISNSNWLLKQTFFILLNKWISCLIVEKG